MLDFSEEKFARLEKVHLYRFISYSYKIYYDCPSSEWCEKMEAKGKNIIPPTCGRQVCLPQVDRFKKDISPL